MFFVCGIYIFVFFLYVVVVVIVQKSTLVVVVVAWQDAIAATPWAVTGAKAPRTPQDHLRQEKGGVALLRERGSAGPRRTAIALIPYLSRTTSTRPLTP